MGRSNLLIGAGVSIVAFVAYVATLYPSVPGGDSGELVGAIATGGVMHPPGYPLYGLLGKLFLLIPHGSIAWRLNLLSAVCDALAAGVLAAAVSRWTRSVWAGVVAGGLFAFSPGVWQYAICAEVFALNNLIIALLILLTVLFTEERKTIWAMAGALVIGLGLANHHTVIFTAAPLVLWVLWVGRSTLLKPGPLLLLIGLVLIGLLPYATLPFDARHHSPISWGQTDTWEGFWKHVLRKEYGTFQLSPGGPAAQTQVGETLAAWSQYLLRDLGWWWLGLAAWGLFEAARERPSKNGLFFVLLVPSVLSVGVLSLLGNLPLTKPLYLEILARFWQQPELYVCIACGLAVVALQRVLKTPLAAPVAAGFIVMIQLGLHGPAMNRHSNELARNYGSEILRSAPPNALLLTKGDLITNTIRYLQHVEGHRSDVRLIDQELLSYDWYRQQIARQYPDIPLPPERGTGNMRGYLFKDLLDGTFGHQPILVCGGVHDGDPSASVAYEMWPYGLCDSVHPLGGPPPIDVWIRFSENALPRMDFAHQEHPTGSWEDVVWGDYWEVRQTRAVQLIGYAGRAPERKKYLEEAARILESVRQENPDPPAHVLRNLAMTYGRIGLETPERRARTADAWRAYLKVAPQNDSQVPAIEAELQRLEGSPSSNASP